jgi:gas vesicle protein
MHDSTEISRPGMLGRLAAMALAALMLAPVAADAQGLVKGMEQGAREGNRAAGPVGGVLGGAIGGVVGVVGGVLGVPANSARPADRAKSKREEAREQAKSAKSSKSAKRQPAAPPELTAEQIIADTEANVARIKAELNLTADQEKHWPAFNSAMLDLGTHGAERLNLRIARAKRDPPDDIVEQMRNEAQFLVDRAQDQRSVADAADPLFASLDDKQKATFIAEMVKLSRERGLD